MTLWWLALFAFILAQAAAHEPHSVESLPGFHGRLPAQLFSGYIEVDSAANKHLFYILTESAHSKSDPLVSIGAFLGGALLH